MLKKKKEPKPKVKLTFAQTIISWTKTLVGAILIVMVINGLAIASFVVPTGSMENTVMTGDFLFVNKFIYGPTTPQLIPFINVPLPYFKFPGFSDPEKGDVIVFIFPGNRDQAEPDEFQYYLKRCVATAGDTLQIISKKLFVNGKEQKLAPDGRFDYNRPIYPGERYQTFPAGRGYTRDDYGPIRIPKEGDIIPLTMSNIGEWEIFIRREGHEISSNGRDILIDGKPARKYVVERNYCFGMGDNRDNSLDSRYWGFIPEEDIVGTPLIVYWSWNTDLPISDLGGKLTSIRWSRIFNLID